MSNRFKIKNTNLGTSPGTLTYVGEEVKFDTTIFWTEYNAESFLDIHFLSAEIMS